MADRRCGRSSAPERHRHRARHGRGQQGEPVSSGLRPRNDCSSSGMNTVRANWATATAATIPSTSRNIGTRKIDMSMSGCAVRRAWRGRQRAAPPAGADDDGDRHRPGSAAPNPSRRATNPVATSASPTVSNGRARRYLLTGIVGDRLRPKPTTATTKGTSMRISRRQLAASSIQPDSSGASSGPSMTTVPEIPTAVALLPSGNMPNAIDVASGTIRPAHSPCRLRAAISQPRVGDAATAMANSPKPAAATRNTCF